MTRYAKMCRVLAVLLLSVLLLGAVAIAEQATQPTAEPTDTEAQTDVGGASLEERSPVWRKPRRKKTTCRSISWAA